MLSKDDLEQIDALLQKRINKDGKDIIKNAFSDFYENIFEPYANKNEGEHKQFVNEMISMKQEIKGLKDETSEIKEFIKDHDKRIELLEMANSTKN